MANRFELDFNEDRLVILKGERDHDIEIYLNGKEVYSPQEEDIFGETEEDDVDLDLLSRFFNVIWESLQSVPLDEDEEDEEDGEDEDRPTEEGDYVTVTNKVGFNPTYENSSILKVHKICPEGEGFFTERGQYILWEEVEPFCKGF